MLILIYLKYPCCGAKRTVYLSLEDPPSPQTFTRSVSHYGCPTPWFVRIHVDWNIKHTKLKSQVEWLEPNKQLYYQSYPNLTSAKKQCGNKCRLFKRCKRCQTCTCHRTKD